MLLDSIFMYQPEEVRDLPKASIEWELVRDPENVGHELYGMPVKVGETTIRWHGSDDAVVFLAHTGLGVLSGLAEIFGLQEIPTRRQAPNGKWYRKTNDVREHKLGPDVVYLVSKG